MNSTAPRTRFILALCGLFLIVGAVGGLMVWLGAIGSPNPASAAPNTSDPCGGCPANKVCERVWSHGAFTWQCIYVNPPPVSTPVPRPTEVPPTSPPGSTPRPPGPTSPAGTPGPTQPAGTPTPCTGTYEMTTPCVDRGPCTKPGQGIDELDVFDCQTGLLVGRAWTANCHDCWGTPTPNVPHPTAIPPTPICQPIVSGGGVSFDPACIAQVRALIPPVSVTRQPYPRGLVGVVNNFSFDGPNQVEVWSNMLPDGVPPGNSACMGVDHIRYRHYQLGLKWVRINSAAWDPGIGVPGPYPPDPQWNFDERPWNGNGTASGESVTHVYETSSWGKPTNGPNGLPSYQVRLSTYWAVFWAVQYDEWQCVDWDEVCLGALPNGRCRCCRDHEASWCPECIDSDGNTRHPAKWVCKKCDWVHKFDGWHLIDLTPYGSPTWYDTSFRVALPQQGVGSSNVIPVPIIESQGVIEQ